MKKILATPALVLGLIVGCDRESHSPRSTSGVQKATVQVPTNPEGLTAEQQNIRDRLLEDNRPGSIKHLYVISAYSGQVIIYSTVRGKVTSGGKRLTPSTVSTVGSDGIEGNEGIAIRIGDEKHYTGEVLQDDGTYGHSMDYLYWWDTKGVYHQHYISGGQIVHISSQPLAVKGIIINMEVSEKPEEKK
jgi:hypothetical protein